MTSQLVVILAIVFVLAIAAAVHGILTWMDRKGWVWYRNKDRGRPTSLGLIEEIYQPSIEHATEQAITDETVADDTESGEPPTTSSAATD